MKSYLNDDHTFLKVLLELAKNRRQTHVCNKLVLAIGFDKNDCVLGYKFNGPPKGKVMSKGLGTHAEERIIKDKYYLSMGLSYVLAVRFRMTKRKRDIRLTNIAICDKCRKISEKSGIPIYSFEEWLEWAQ